MCRKEGDISYTYFPAVELEDEISIYPFIHGNIGDYLGDSQRCIPLNSYNFRLPLENVREFSKTEFIEFSMNRLRACLQEVKNNFLRTRVENKQRFSPDLPSLQFNIIYEYKDRSRFSVCFYYINNTTLSYKMLPYVGFLYEGFFQPY